MPCVMSPKFAPPAACAFAALASTRRAAVVAIGRCGGQIWRSLVNGGSAMVKSGRNLVNGDTVENANRSVAQGDSLRRGGANHQKLMGKGVAWSRRQNVDTIDAMADVLVLANPKAGRGRSGALADRLATALADAGYAVGRAIDASLELPAAAVVIGGDGSLRYAAGELLKKFGEVPPLVVIPGGTANLMARHLLLRWEKSQLESQVVAAINARKLQYVDAATANGELFLLIAGVGFDGSVVRILDQRRTGPITLFNYIIPMVQTIWQNRYERITVYADGQHIFGPAAGLAFVGNVKEYGTGFPVVPEAISDDGLLDVCVLPCGGHDDLMRIVLHMTTGEHPKLDDAIYLRAKRVRVTSASPLPVQIDGDPAGVTPLEIEMLADRVPFIVRGES